MIKKLILSLVAMSVFALSNAGSVYAASKWVTVKDQVKNDNGTYCYISARYRPEDPTSARVSVRWRTKGQTGWQVVDYGNGQNFESDRKRATKTFRKLYSSLGSYTATITTDAKEGDENPCTASVNLNFTGQPLIPNNKVNYYNKVTRRWVTARDRAVTDNARCSIMARYKPNDLKSARFVVYWKTSEQGGWHIVDYGNGLEYGTEKKRGAKLLKFEYYEYKPYTVTFTTDKVDGNEASCTVSVNLEFVQPETN